MFQSLTSATHKAPQTKYILNNQVKTLKVDGELEPEIKDGFQANAADGWREAPMLDPKNLRTITNPETFAQLQTAGETWEPIKLDLGTGEREYQAHSDKEGNIKITDSEDISFSPQVISVNKHGNRVHLSTAVRLGEDTLVQDIRMNLTDSGNFYASEETIGVNARSLLTNHHSASFIRNGVFAQSRSL